MGKKPRTAKQRAATRRMIAANRRGKVRHGRPGKSYGLVEGAGALAVGVGFLGKNAGGNKSSLSLVKGAFSSGSSGLGASARDIAYNLKQSVPLVGSDPHYAGNRALVAWGAIAALVGAKLRKLPLVGKVARLGFKLDRKTRVRVA